MTKTEILKRLDEITKHHNFFYILCKIVIRDFTGPIDILFSKNNREHLNHKEFNFLIGLWIKNIQIDLCFEEGLENKIFHEVYVLMEKLHFTFLENFKIDPNVKPDLYEHFNKGGAFQEAMFYSGSGAYDNQYKRLSIEKYKYDDDWLQSNKAFTLKSLPKFYDHLKTIQERKINAKEIWIRLDEKKRLDYLFCLSKDEIINNNVEFGFILEALKVDINLNNNKHFKDIGDFNTFNERPLIQLNENSYFFPSAFALSESIYESPYYWMIADKKYQSQAFLNRGKVAEDIVKKIISPIFGEKNIYQNIIINKSKNDQITDIDVLALHYHKGLIFQIKSKKLTALSKNGNLESIKDDFKKAVQDAYEQGLISKECLLNHNDYKFNRDKTFVDRINLVKEYYIITVVLDDYPAITHQAHILLGNKTDELPVAVNIFDLELIAKYLSKPDKFIDYISRRIKFSKIYRADNEMTYLGFHLQKGLQKMNADYVALDNDWAQSIDRKYYHELYKTKTTNESAQKKVQRNDPCPCKSGLKYKKCHGKL
ncbi:YecA family protein [Flavobacterium sp. 22076]|uniref:YecA family protein n=1 Tax=unclassified Flavobacterium TaxID=196869 RepID=UPI003F838498